MNFHFVYIDIPPITWVESVSIKNNKSSQNPKGFWKLFNIFFDWLEKAEWMLFLFYLNNVKWLNNIFPSINIRSKSCQILLIDCLFCSKHVKSKNYREKKLIYKYEKGKINQVDVQKDILSSHIHTNFKRVFIRTTLKILFKTKNMFSIQGRY